MLFSFSRYLNFCLDFSVKYKNNFVRKIRLILKSLTSQPGKQTIAIYILPNISQSKSNQMMKFGHLIEYNMKNHAQNVLQKLFPDPFLKTQN